jgi:hypothetical protein
VVATRVFIGYPPGDQAIAFGKYAVPDGDRGSLFARRAAKRR